MLPRFYIESSIKTGESLLLPEATGHHLSRVLRLDTTDRIILFNGLGGEYECTINAISKKQVEVLPETFSIEDRSSELEIHLGISVLKKDAMDRAIAKSVEVGVQTITPIISEHCTVAKKVINNRLSHWQQVVISACEQCGLNLVPTLAPATTFDHWINHSNADLKIIADGSGSRFKPENKPVKIDLAIGPEGGFSSAETLQAFDAGFKPLSFGPRILRAETAPVAAVTTLRYALGE